MLDCLIIDDDASIVDAVCEYFNLFDVSCTGATEFETGLAAVAEQHPSLILLDINLGERSGFALCKQLRESSDAPVIFISARNTDDDILAALSVGGDDYITKPFSMAVLLAKARVILERRGNQQKKTQQESISFGTIKIDRDSGRAQCSGEEVKLKPMELKLLLYLYDNKGRMISKDELLENVWQDTFIGEGTLSVHIRHLREKLEEAPHAPQFIKTVWGSGYLFEDKQ